MHGGMGTDLYCSAVFTLKIYCNVENLSGERSLVGGSW